MGPQLGAGILTPKRQNTVPRICQRYHFVKKKELWIPNTPFIRNQGFRYHGRLGHGPLMHKLLEL